jgi:hypothetical protein
MNNYWRTTKTLLLCLALMVGGFSLGVTFLGDSWNDQWHDVLAIINLLVLIVLCAAALIGLVKFVGLLWDKLIGSKVTDENEDLQPPTNSHQDNE